MIVNRYMIGPSMKNCSEQHEKKKSQKKNVQDQEEETKREKKQEHMARKKKMEMIGFGGKHNGTESNPFEIDIF